LIVVKALFALLLVACGAPSSPHENTLKGTFEPTKPAKRTTPAPSIAYADDRFQLHGFPAIARDRRIVALPVSDSDGGRGYPDLRIELRFESDKTFETIPVMTSNEYEALVANGDATPELRRRLDKANARLRELHEQSDLVTMLPGENLQTEFVVNTTYEVRYDGNAVRLVLDADHSFSFEHADWKAPKGPTCNGCGPCENPERLHNVFYAEGINAIVVEFQYEGTDLCWEPGNQLHVLTW
jgi:hypothetical protein